MLMKDYQDMVMEELKQSLEAIVASSDNHLPETMKMDGDKVVSLVAVFADNRMLMGRRRDSGKWTLPGGGVGSFETAQQGARRELYEETGINFPIDAFSLVKTFEIHVQLNVFRVDYAQRPTDLTIDPDKEFSETQWVDVRNGLPPEIELHHKGTLPYDALGIPVQRTDSVDRMDSTVDRKLSEVFASIDRKLRAKHPDQKLRGLAKSAVHGTAELTKKNAAQSARRVELEIEPMLHDRELDPYFKTKIEENLDLIKSIPEREKNRLKSKVSKMVREGSTAKQIFKELKSIKSKNVSKRQAANISRDQVSKLNGELTKHRQAQMGVTHYIWRTMQDERVRGTPGGLYPNARPSHYKLDGKKFSWKTPPESGTNFQRQHPSEPQGCRCYAEPVLDDLIE